jgi:hypothetical protein
MNLTFSAHTNCACDGCSNNATHGFFLSYAEDHDSEIFLCTGCSQKDIPAGMLEAAIEDHRQLCFDLAERDESELESAYLDWVAYEGVAVAC